MTDDNLNESTEIESEEADTKKNKRKPKTPPRPFPAESLEKALKIPKAIKEFNGGNPWASGEVAGAIKLSPKGTPFWYITAAARDYGLTIGTRDTEKIEIASLGKNIVFATSPEMEAESIKKAFFNVDIFKNVYEHYNGGQLPELNYLRNTLQTEFSLHQDHIDDFYKVFQENVDFVHKYAAGQEKTKGKSNDANTNSDAVVLGQPNKDTKTVAFVIMPFVEKDERYPQGFFDEVLQNLITPAAVEAGFKVETAKKSGSDVIQSTIVKELLEADLVIADLTAHNPNVLFELGMRMAFDKPVALIRAEGTGPIFDVDNMLRVYGYSPMLWKSTLERDIPKMTKHIQAAWDNRDTDNSYLKILKGKA